MAIEMNRLRIILSTQILPLLLFFTTALGAPQVVVGLPYDVPDDAIRPLRELVNGDLQALLEQRLNKNRVWSRLIAQEKMCVGLVDIRDPLDVRFARVNGNVMLYAASLPKLAILLAAVQSFEDGSLSETPEITKDIRLMISRSDNEASSRMIERIGTEKIIAVLTSPRYKLYDEDYGGGLWVGKKYAREPKTHPDPILNLSHAATASQVCRFYYLLAMGKLVNQERSRQMMNFLVDPQIEHKFVSVLRKIVPTARLFRKSGTWKIWHADSVLVWGPIWRRYIAVALIEDNRGEKILRELIPVLEQILLTYTNKIATVK